MVYRRHPRQTRLLEYLDFLLELAAEFQVDFIQLNQVSGPPYPSFSEVESWPLHRTVAMNICPTVAGHKRSCVDLSLSWLDLEAPFRSSTRPAKRRSTC